MSFRKTIGLLGASIALGCGALAGNPGAVAHAALCGYTGEDDGYSNKANYNNCTSGPERIRVEYTYATSEMCVSPGDTTLYADPDLGAVRNAVALGPC